MSSICDEIEAIGESGIWFFSLMREHGKERPRRVFGQQRRCEINGGFLYAEMEIYLSVKFNSRKQAC
jgi:hypothetical protein